MTMLPPLPVPSATEVVNPDYARGEESPDPESWRINDLLVK
jgi:hypothetical protein